MKDPSPILPNDVDALRAMEASKDAEIHVRDLMIEKLKHQSAGHQRNRFSATSETLGQLALDIEDREIGEAVTPAKTDDATASTSDIKRHE